MGDRYDDWLNTLTDEELQLHQDSMALADAEFEIEVAEQMGPYGLDALDASKANVREIINRPDLEWYTKGFYIPEDFYLDRGYYDYIKWKTGEPIVADEVNAIGVENATPEIWGHEFTHAYVEKKRDEEGRKGEFLRDQFTREKKPDEKINLLWDAYRAKDKRQWNNAVGLWRSDLNENERGRGRFDNDRAEEDLRRVLDKHKGSLVDQEAQARSEKVPMEMEDLRRLYRKKYEKRMKSWNDE